MKHIQFPHFFVNAPKKEAFNALATYINEHKAEFVDGEEVIIKYLGENGEKISSNAIIGKYDNTFTLDEVIVAADTLRIIEKDGEIAPSDTEALWLSDYTESGETGDLKSQVKELTRQLKNLSEMVHAHQDVLTNSLGGGELEDSTKLDLENRSQQEQPKESTFYDTVNTAVTSIGLYINDVELDEYSKEDTPYFIYRDAYYPLELRLFNNKGKEVKETPEITQSLYFHTASQEADADIKILSGDTEVPPQRLLYITSARTSGYTTTIVNYTSEEGEQIQKQYVTPFQYEEKPSWEPPTPKHLLVKHVKTYEELEARQAYLNLYEFVWCIGNNSLYFKAEASNGTIGLFKINGGGVTPTPTGETSGTTYIVKDEILEIIDETSATTVDSEGYLELFNGAYVDEEGYIVLKDSGGGGSETEVEIDGDNLIFTNANVDENGYIKIDSSKIYVDENEIMNI